MNFALREEVPTVPVPEDVVVESEPSECQREGCGVWGAAGFLPRNTVLMCPQQRLYGRYTSLLTQ